MRQKIDPVIFVVEPMPHLPQPPWTLNDSTDSEMPDTSAPRRGRPRNSGLDDDAVLDRIEAELRSRPGISTRQAIIAASGGDHPSSIRRLERKLQDRRRASATQDAGTTWADLESILLDASFLCSPISTYVTDKASLIHHMRRSTAIGYAMVRLNAHEHAFDHRTLARIAIGENDEVRLSTTTTGRSEIIAPPQAGDYVSRAVHLAWEQTGQCVVLSPEEQKAWDETDGAYWRVMNDWFTPRWRKILPMWRRPDLSMTRALKRIALENGWRAAEVHGRGIDLDAKLSCEAREPIPPSRMTTLPERLLRATRDRLSWWGWRILHPRTAVFPLVSGPFATLFPGDSLYFAERYGVQVDSVGDRYTNVDLHLQRHASGLRQVHRAVVEPGCLVRNTWRKEPIPPETAADMMLRIEELADRMFAPRPFRRSIGFAIRLIIALVLAILVLRGIRT